MYDLVIRGGEVHDGSGAPGRLADVAVADGRIVAVGLSLDGDGVEVVDATGKIVTPGFVDIHTHYDGQVFWDDLLEPTSAHGVTTALVGNCGVGFAPVANAAGRERLLDLMAGVEDIPRTTLATGIEWSWRTFTEYLDALEDRRLAIDVGTQVPHGAVRALVRPNGDDGRPSTAEEIEMMSTVVRDAIEAGAFSLTTSRTVGHVSIDGTPVPGTFATYDELHALAVAVRAGGGRLLEVAGSGLAAPDDVTSADTEVDFIGRLAESTGLPATYILLQCHHAPERWRHQAAQAAAWRARGADLVALIAGRPFTAIWGWDVRHPFLAKASYRALADRPLGERLEELRRADVRARILAEPDEFRTVDEQKSVERVRRALPSSYPWIGEPDYEPTPAQAIGAVAAACGVSLEAAAYDALTADGAMLCNFVYNYADGDHAVLHEQLLDPTSVIGLNDGGAHTALICDATIPTYMLTHWVRDRVRGPRLALTEVVRRLTAQPAALYGLADRGRIEPGLRADLNVIDVERLHLGVPRAVHDLPAGGVRMLQDSGGYCLTTVAGVVTRRNGVDTGARPGRLLRRSSRA
ncbi:MAG: amidohydrolase family protein [Acidimicrobiia bacterium]